MSLQTFPAQSGTYLIERERGEKEARKIPVVAYTHVQGGIVFPLCAIAHGGLTIGRALVTPDGFVTDPAYGVVCGNVEEWMRLTSTEGYWAAKSKVARSTPLPPDDPEPAAPVTPPATAKTTTAEKLVNAGKTLAPTRIPDKPKGKPQLFQTTSFWQAVGDRGDVDFIFKVEGGCEAPAKNDSNYAKIKRDDWQAAKKADVPVHDWPFVARKPGTEAATDDEDDGADLI